MKVFDDIYASNRWNGVDTRSGPGSGSAATRHLLRDVLALLEDLAVESVLDVGCGEGFWQDFPVRYRGLDVSNEAIEKARELHPDRDLRVWDPAAPLPGGWELVLCRDVMQHLSLADGGALLSKIRTSGARWLLASTYVGGRNVNIRNGQCYELDLTARPFWAGAPMRVLFDGGAWEEGEPVRDMRKMLALWKLG